MDPGPGDGRTCTDVHVNIFRGTPVYVGVGGGVGRGSTGVVGTDPGSGGTLVSALGPNSSVLTRAQEWRVRVRWS